MLLRKILQNAGFNVIDVDNGKSAREAVREHQPKLVLVDWNMPIMDGRAVVENLKTDAATLNIPIMMLTGHSQIEDKIAALESGAQDFMTKPFDARELVARVKQQLRWKTLVSQNEKESDDTSHDILEGFYPKLTPFEVTIPPGVVKLGPVAFRRRRSGNRSYRENSDAKRAAKSFKKRLLGFLGQNAYHGRSRLNLKARREPLKRQRH